MPRARSFLTSPAPRARSAPGAYRAYVSPAALDELLWMLNWGGVSAKEQRTQQSTIQQLVDGEVALSPLVHAARAHRRRAGTGLRRGRLHPPRLGGPDPRRPARAQPGEPAHGAGVRHRVERRRRVRIDAGDGSGARQLPRAEALRALDTGVYVGNFHYLNWSDRSAARVTGMTRFATYWVERGEIVAPLAVMRFDDSLYRLLGTELKRWTTSPTGSSTTAPTAAGRCRPAAFPARC